MSEIKVDTLTGKTTANDITVTVGATATMSLEQGLAKAWFHFNMSTATIQDSLNAASITDSAAGTFLMNVSNALSSSEYATLSAGGDNAINNNTSDTNQPTSSSQYRHNHFENNVATDIANVSNSAVGDLA